MFHLVLMMDCWLLNRYMNSDGCMVTTLEVNTAGHTDWRVHLLPLILSKGLSKYSTLYAMLPQCIRAPWWAFLGERLGFSTRKNHFGVDTIINNQDNTCDCLTDKDVVWQEHINQPNDQPTIMCRPNSTYFISVVLLYISCKGLASVFLWYGNCLKHQLSLVLYINVVAMVQGQV